MIILVIVGTLIEFYKLTIAGNHAITSNKNDKNFKMNKLNEKSSDDGLKNLIPVKNKGNLYPLNKYLE